MRIKLTVKEQQAQRKIKGDEKNKRIYSERSSDEKETANRERMSNGSISLHEKTKTELFYRECAKRNGLCARIKLSQKIQVNIKKILIKINTDRSIKARRKKEMRRIIDDALVKVDTLRDILCYQLSGAPCQNVSQIHSQ